MNKISQIKLNGCFMPIVGLGTWQLKGKEAQNAVETALSIGYRHIDTADVYQNHQEVAKGIKNSKVDREEIFLTSKVFREDLECDDVIKSAEKFLGELETDYLDMLLVHWPNSKTPFEETVDGLDCLKERGKIRDYGVSNFTINHLRELEEKELLYDVVNNQIEFHPSLNQKELQKFCEERGIVITAYSPIAQGDALKLKVTQDLAKKYEKTPAQIVLNWHISQGRVVIPRSSSKKHLEENFNILSWRLEDKDIEKIENIGGNKRIVKPPFHEFDK